MRVCVFGAGAVGGHVAVRLAAAGACEVSVVARGAHLEAIRRNGLRLISGEESLTQHFTAVTDDPGSLPPQDLVFVAIKAHGLAAAAAEIDRVASSSASVVYAANGIPWWWGYHGTGEFARGGGHPVQGPDPARAIGCVVYSVNEVVQPGVIRHRGNNRWILGEPSNALSPRLERVAELLRGAGLHAEVSDELRLHVWRKLLRNITINPLCAITRLDVDRLVASPGLAKLGYALAAEAVAVARAKGFDLAAYHQEATAFLAQAPQAGGVAGTKPSMLQDVLAGRPMEVDALIGDICRFAREEGVATPTLDAVFAIAQGLNAGIAGS
jgi:2-dehydropantoate 2-reductase